MPEASVNKNDGFIFGENKIWFARQLRITQSISESLCMQSPPQGQFRLGIATADIRYIEYYLKIVLD